MIKNVFLIFFALVLVAGGVGLYLFQSDNDSKHPAFSSFVEIDAQLFDTSVEQPLFPSLFLYLVSEPKSYPTSELKSEINRLVELSSQRTESLIAEHNEEYNNVLSINVGNDKKLSDYIGPETHPLTNEIYRLLSNDLEIVVANKKLSFDVARPKQIDLRVNTTVETPATPSYPSLFAADVSLIGEILLHFMKPEEYQVVSDSIATAIERKQIVGVSTKFDTDYGSELAKQYAEIVLNHEKSTEFLNLVREKEWSNDEPWIPVNSGRSLSNLTLTHPTFTLEGRNVTFKSTVENNGEAKTPDRFILTIEIDRYTDGSVDTTLEFPVGALNPDEVKEVAYLLNIDWPGTHSFRFIVNKNLNFLEEYHHDNYGAWTEFTIEE